MHKNSQNSHIQNDARLKVLQAREKHVRSVLEEAQHKLVELTSDPSMYEKVLQKLLEQGLFQLVERNVSVRCREADEQFVRNIIPDAVEEYKQATKQNVTVTLDTQNYLPRDCSGGVELYTFNSKIKSINTLESRLDMISKQILPDIRVALFGSNPNRKFSD